jgi:hypothetical protein
LLALLSVWTGLITLALSTVMLVFRPAMTDTTVVLVLYFGAPGAMCFGGLVLWAYRKESGDEEGIAAQRAQAKVGIGLAVAASAIVYCLIIFARQVERIDGPTAQIYNPSSASVVMVGLDGSPKGDIMESAISHAVYA